MHGDRSVFESPEAWELRRVLQALAEPGHRTLTRTALSTRLLGLSAGDLTRMRERLDIEILEREAQRLPSTEASWLTTDPEDRVAFRAEWHDLMDVFRHLAAAHDDGRLPRDLQQQLAELSARLADLAPVLERLRLRQPDPETLARLRLAAAG
jgi:ATP-dependent exoDNAse (exonuclease V) beta subunit